MNSTPLLSICVLTFNRAELMRETVNSVFAQLDEELGAKIEVVICDNASTDATAIVSAELLKSAPRNVRSYRNEQNVQFDGNCLLAVERAKGAYVWMLGDDLIAAGALAAICREIESAPEIDVFLSDKENFFLTPDRPMRRRPVINLKEPKVYDFQQAKEIDDYFRANKKLIAYFNFVSIIVFKRERWQRVQRKDDFAGTGYIHVYALQSILWGQERGRLKYLPNALTRQRWGTDPNYNPEQKLRHDFVMFHRIAEAVFSNPKYIWMIDDLVIRNDGFSWAVRVKIASPGNFFKVHLPFLIYHYGSHPLLWLKIVPLVVVPRFILKLARDLYKKYFKGENLGLIGIIRSKT